MLKDVVAAKPLTMGVMFAVLRVPVLEAHTEAVYVSMGRAATVEQVKNAMKSYGRDFAGLGLPSCPPRLIDVTDDPFRPQPRLDRDRRAACSPP